MSGFQTKRLPTEATAVAPDGSAVRVLPEMGGGSMAHFQLAPGEVSIAVAHRSGGEIWYVVRGRGEMWRKLGDQEEVVCLEPASA